MRNGILSKVTKIVDLVLIIEWTACENHREGGFPLFGDNQSEFDLSSSVYWNRLWICIFCCCRNISSKLSYLWKQEAIDKCFFLVNTDSFFLCINQCKLFIYFLSISIVCIKLTIKHAFSVLISAASANIYYNFHILKQRNSRD